MPGSRLHLSIRWGSKARPAVRDSDLEHRVFGHKTRNHGTPLTAFIVGSRQKTSSATLRKVGVAFSVPGRGREIQVLPGFSIADAGEGAPLPLHPIPANADLHTPEKTVLL